MKNIYILILITFTAFAASAQRTLITFCKTTGNWSGASNWSPSRVPQSNDSVVIPKTGTVTFDQAASYSNMYITVAGTLSIKATMTLDAASAVELKPTGNVTLHNGGNANAQMIVLAGAVKFDQNSTSPTTGPAAATQYSNGFGPVSILPVVFTSFYASRQNNHAVILTWATAQEINNNSFEVQRSIDGQNWTTVAALAGAGNSNRTQHYRYADETATSEVVYYRIRQIDANGNSQVSALKVIHMSGAAEGATAKVQGYNKCVTVHFNGPVKNTMLVRVISLNGQVMAQQNVERNSYATSLSLTHINGGVYLVQVSDGQAINESSKVVL